MFDGLRSWASGAAAAAITLAVAHAHVQAQGVYRIVGSDGRVTYADQPPPTIAPRGRIDVLRASGGPVLVPPAPVAAPGPAPLAAEAPGPASARGEPKRQNADPRQGAVTSAAAPASPAVDPVVEAAVIGVLGAEDIVKRTESICVSTLPASARRYASAVDEWARRNARTVVVARRVLTREFDVEKREQVEQDVRARNTAQFEKVVDAPADVRIAWCDRSAAEIAGGRMDVYDKPRLAGPLAELPAR